MDWRKFSSENDPESATLFEERGTVINTLRSFGVNLTGLREGLDRITISGLDFRIGGGVLQVSKEAKDDWYRVSTKEDLAKFIRYYT